jgi:hypothetical protein
MGRGGKREGEKTRSLPSPPVTAAQRRCKVLTEKVEKIAGKSFSQERREQKVLWL